MLKWAVSLVFLPTDEKQNKVVDTHPLAWLDFSGDGIMIGCKSGMLPNLDVYPSE